MNMENRNMIFSQEEQNIMKSLAEDITASPSEEPELFCQQCKKASLLLPESIKVPLLHFKNYGSKTGFLCIDTQIIEEDLPITPKDNNEKQGENTLLSKIQGIIMEFLGEMVAYEAEGYGRLFQDVIPNQSMAKQQTSLGSHTELEIHTEQAFSELRPDFLSLACLRGDKHAQTFVLPVSKMIETMSCSNLELLYQPLWKTGVDLSFKMGGYEFIEGETRGPMPILTGSFSDPRLRFDQDLMTGLDEHSQRLIKEIVQIYYQHRYAHCLQPGEIIWVDNRRAVHGRSPFFPRFDGYDRFIVRCFGVVDYEKSSYARQERTIQAIYS